MVPGILFGLVLLPVLASAAAIPSNNVTKIALNRNVLFSNSGVANIPALRQHLGNVVNKYQHGFSNFQKNTGHPHPLSVGSFFRHLFGGHRLKRAEGNVPLSNFQSGAVWSGAISVGTPPVTYTVDFDTGSSDLFLPGANCDSTCAGHTLYNTASSSTAVDQGQTFSLAFGDGSSVTGEVFVDTVTISGLTATGQAVGAANQYSSSFEVSQFPADGLMGMAFQSISAFDQSPVFQTLINQGQTTSPVFGFSLTSTGGELTIGGVDGTQFAGTLTQVPVTQQGYWQVDLAAVNVNGQATVTGVSAIIDTGTSLVLGNTANVAQFYAAIPGSADATSTVGAGFFTVPCASIPSVSLTFGSTAFPISADTFNLGQVSAGSADCVGGMVASDLGSFWVAGDVFLQNVYTSFDMGNNQVGFAALA